LCVSIIAAALIYICLLGGLRAITKAELEDLRGGFAARLIRKAG
jgi:hypothetical protein